jgi:hypothetical protein
MVNVYPKISRIKIRNRLLKLNDATEEMKTDIKRCLDSNLDILTKLPTNHPYLNRLEEAYNKVVRQFNTKYQEFLTFQDELMSYMESLDSADTIYILTRATQQTYSMEKSLVHCLKLNTLMRKLRSVEETKESN